MTGTISSLGAREAEFLAAQAASGRTVFRAAEANAFWPDRRDTKVVLHRLAKGGWLRRLARGLYMVVPLEAGPDRAWTEDLVAVVPHLVQPSAVAYWSALRLWEMTEQLPRVLFVQTTKRRRPADILGTPVRFVTVTTRHFFGLATRNHQGRPVQITDREKTLLDAAARPDLSGGVSQLAQAMVAAGGVLNWSRFDEYVVRWGGGAAVKRLGYMVEELDLPIPDRAARLSKWRALIRHGVSMLEPGAGEAGRVAAGWRLRINVPLDSGPRRRP